MQTRSGCITRRRKCSDHQRVAAAEALAAIGDTVPVEHFIWVLNEPDTKTWLRRVCIESLTKLRAEAAVPHFIQALQDSDNGIRRAAATGLADLRWLPRTPSERVWFGLVGIQRFARYSLPGAFAHLAGIRKGACDELWLAFKTHADDWVKSCAQWGLAELGDERVAYELLSSCRTKDDIDCMAQFLKLRSPDISTEDLQRFAAVADLSWEETEDIYGELGGVEASITRTVVVSAGEVRSIARTEISRRRRKTQRESLQKGLRRFARRLGLIPHQ